MKVRTDSGGYTLISTALVGMVMLLITSTFFAHAMNRYSIARESERAQRSYFIARGGPAYVQFLAQHHGRDLFDLDGLGRLDHTLAVLADFPFHDHSEIQDQADWEGRLEALLRQTPAPNAVLFVEMAGGGADGTPEYRLFIWDDAWGGQVTTVMTPVLDALGNYDNMYEITSEGMMDGKRLSVSIEMDAGGNVLSWF